MRWMKENKHESVIHGGQVAFKEAVARHVTFRHTALVETICHVQKLSLISKEYKPKKRS